LSSSGSGPNLGGEERDIMAGYGAAVSAIESVTGRSVETKRRT
jgi:hypothetical protein